MTANVAAEEYPSAPTLRTGWILRRRHAKAADLDPWRARGFLVEEECDAARRALKTLTIFLTNRECPWKCVFCDLWRETLDETVPIGAIPAQIRRAREESGVLGPTDQLKLYNSGSFFDRAAVPVRDYGAIAEFAVAGGRTQRVVVESHPRLAGSGVLRFRDRLAVAAGTSECALEVAFGLETANPAALERLNKRMTLAQFRSAAGFLAKHGVDLRVFLLVHPPWIGARERMEWLARSLRAAFDAGATVVSLIPARLGNGALEALAARGEFEEPSLGDLELALECGLAMKRARVFADLWDLERFSRCGACFEPRRDRLRRMNMEQAILPGVRCPKCIE